VYTDSLIVTTPTDSHTSLMIAKQESELPCTKPSSVVLHYCLEGVQLVLALMIAVAAMLLNALIIVMQLVLLERL